MKRETVTLALLTFVGSAICWLPIIIFPRLEISWWYPFSTIALSACLAGMLRPNLWGLFIVSSSLGTFFGEGVGYMFLWPPADGITATYTPFEVLLATLLVAVATTLSAFLGSRIPATAKPPKIAAWALVVLPAVFWLAALAATPSLAQRRIVRNQHFAEQRLFSLFNAAEATMVTPSTSARLCDGSVLRRNYTGRPFSDNDWTRITGNYVLQDRYMFMFYCQEKERFTIHAMPKEFWQDGNRYLCIDQSGQLGCGMESSALGHRCLPCPK
jgi:hypothetical protein